MPTFLGASARAMRGGVAAMALIAASPVVIGPREAAAITTFGDSSNALYAAPGASAFSGIARLAIGGVGCSGSLLGTGLHVLTAGHCVVGSFGDPLPGAGTARFITAGGTTDVAVAEFIVNPGWDGNLFSGGDLAILRLAAAAPGDALRYDFYTGTDEVGQIANLAGFGEAGTGANGNTIAFGARRQGLNRLDGLGSLFGASAAILLGDFDNGLAANDALASVGVANLGEGEAEVMVAPGDSGGPSFLDGKVAGVHSFRATFGICPPDVSTPANFDGAAGCKLDSSFGEVFGDIRVSSHLAFIRETIGPATEIALIEPATLGLFGLGLIGLILAGRRRGATARDESVMRSH